jgi:TolA-binding protein
MILSIFVIIEILTFFANKKNIVMKLLKATSVIVLLAFGALLIQGCQGKSEKEKFQDKIEDKMDVLNNELEELETKLSHSDEKAKEEINEKIEELKGERSKLEKKIDELEDASEKEFLEMKTEVKNKYDKLKNDIEDMKEE